MLFLFSLLHFMIKLFKRKSILLVQRKYLDVARTYCIKFAPILVLKNSLPHIIGIGGDTPASESAGAWNWGIKNCCAHFLLRWEHNDAAVKYTTRPCSLLVCEKQASPSPDLDDMNRRVELCGEWTFRSLPSILFCLSIVSEFSIVAHNVWSRW